MGISASSVDTTARLWDLYRKPSDFSGHGELVGYLSPDGNILQEAPPTIRLWDAGERNCGSSQDTPRVLWNSRQTAILVSGRRPDRPLGGRHRQTLHIQGHNLHRGLFTDGKYVYGK
jgi:WD40 repeat protein